MPAEFFDSSYTPPFTFPFAVVGSRSQKVDVPLKPRPPTVSVVAFVQFSFRSGSGGGGGEADAVAAARRGA